MALLTFPSVAIAQKKSSSNYNPKYAALVMDAATGDILYERYADKQVYPASLTKIMTLLMIFDEIDAGRLSLNDNIRFSQHAASMSPSKIGIRAGGTMRVSDAIKAIVTKSANDVSAAVGEHISGNEAAFARSMTRRAQAIGMSNTRFRNASGLPDSGQVTTARDMAKLARYMIVSRPQYFHYFGLKSFSYQGATHVNHNRLLQSYKGMDGIKTGFINASGFNLVASAKRDNNRLIGVVFGGRSTQSRNDHMVKLLDDGFDRMRNRTQVASATSPASLSLAVRGTGSTISAPAPTPAVLPTRKPTPPPQALAMVAPTAAPAEPQGLTSVAAQAKSPVQPAPTAIPTNTLAVRPPPEYQEAKLVEASYATMPADATRAIATDSASADAHKPSSWAIQIGAFQSRAATDLALQSAKARLPATMARAQPEIVPYKTAQSEWVFRARLRGFDKDEAAKACKLFSECLTVSPGRL